MGTNVTFRYEIIRFRDGDQDPIVDQVRTALEQEFGRGSKMDKAPLAIEHNGGPLAATVRNWLNGKTMRPMNVTIDAALAAVGMERYIRKMDAATAKVIKMADKKNGGVKKKKSAA